MIQEKGNIYPEYKGDRMTRSFRFGSVKIANETIEAIARKATSEVNGVIENTKSNK